MLVPSRFEPCGLTQLYAMRYGTPPIVRRTGGLADTVADARDAVGTGFLFDAIDPDAFLGAATRAALLRRDPARWEAVVRAGMSADFSWSRAAERYADLYRDIARPA
jgi:starch synthase